MPERDAAQARYTVAGEAEAEGISMTDDDLKIRIADVLRKANEAAGFTVYTAPVVMMLRREPGLVSCVVNCQIAREKAVRL